MNLLVYSVYCIVVVSLFIFVDTTVASLGTEERTHIWRILLDSYCHSMIAGLIWLASTLSTKVQEDRGLYKRNSSFIDVYRSLGNSGEVMLSMLIGSAVDVDHFIAAGSPSLAAATHLPSRPWGHSVLVCAVFALAAWALMNAAVKLQQRFGTPWFSGVLTNATAQRVALLTFSAYIAHLLRDSVRRGMWLGTLSINNSISTEDVVQTQRSVNLSTPALPLWLVLGIYCILPALNRNILARIVGPPIQIEEKRLDELKSEV